VRVLARLVHASRTILVAEGLIKGGAYPERPTWIRTGSGQKHCRKIWCSDPVSSALEHPSAQ